MSRKNIIIPLIAAILCLFAGVLIGILVKDFPLFELDATINIVDAASLVVTIAIGILVPFLLKRWIDDTRQAKGYVVEELRSFLNDIQEIPSLVKQLFFAGTINQSDKTRINVMFETIDVKLSNLTNELEAFCDKETFPMRNKLNECYMNYWKYLTGSEIMSSKFKSIDEAFYKKATSLYLETETRIKDIIRLMYS